MLTAVLLHPRGHNYRHDGVITFPDRVHFFFFFWYGGGVYEPRLNAAGETEIEQLPREAASSTLAPPTQPHARARAQAHGMFYNVESLLLLCVCVCICIYNSLINH